MALKNSFGTVNVKMFMLFWLLSFPLVDSTNSLRVYSCVCVCVHVCVCMRARALACVCLCVHGGIFVCVRA